MGGMVHIFNHKGGGRHLTDHQIHPSLGIMNEEENVLLRTEDTEQ